MSMDFLKSLHRRTIGISKDDQVMARKGFVSGGDGSPAIIHPSPDTVAIFDDFIGDTGRGPLTNNTDPYWRAINNDTGLAGSSVVLVPGTNGIARITAGTTPVAQTKVAINQNLAWKGNQGSIPSDNKHGVRLSARLKVSGWKDTGQSTATAWVGFTDTLTTTEVPVADTGGAVVSTATDAVGISFSSNPTATYTGWTAYAVNNDVNATPVNLDTGVAANIYDTVEVEIHHGVSDTGGTASFFVNGVRLGTIPSPVQMGVALTPTVMIWGDTGGGVALDLDWINVSAPRDTGA